jgi:hypothetical protein
LSATFAGGVFALAGVAIGGLLNYLVTTAIEERRGQQAMRTSARIVGEEVGTNLAIITSALELETGPRSACPVLFQRVAALAPSLG